MKGVRSIVDRFTRSSTETAAPAPRPIERPALPSPFPFRRNWRKRVEKIATNIQQITAELADLDRQRADAALREQEGDEAAGRELANIRGKIAKAHDRLDDLRAAHGAAAGKVEAEIVEAEAKARREQEREITAAHKRMADALKAADRAIETAAAELGNATQAAAEIQRAAGTSDVAQIINEGIFGRVKESIAFRFRGYGLRQGSPFTTEAQVPLAQYTPPAEYLVENAKAPTFARPNADEEPATVDGEDLAHA